MCGICGYISKTKISYDEIQSMNDTLYHRGPNDSGIWEYDAQGQSVGIAQRRLSIMDLSALGHQPMETADGRYVISYNGEVYNFKEIRKNLEAEGSSFESECDTEVILKAYVKYQEKCFEKFNGMFAIAIYDKDSHKLVMARDRIGKKPLYYFYKSGTLIFGSELKPLMACSIFEKEIDTCRLGQFFCNKYIPSPYTIFKDTYKVEPGTYVVYEKDIITCHRFWDLKQIFNSCTKRDLSIVDEKKSLNELVVDSVKKRLVADVPVGTFLSGGIDSTLVSAVANKLKLESGEGPIDSFTIGFHEKERDEAPYAREISKHIGTNHHELYMGESEILAMLDDLPQYYDEPFSDASALPTMLVSKMASKEVTGILSGDGGDETFCGYEMYDWTYIVQHFDFAARLESMMPWNDALTKNRPMLKAIMDNRNDDFKVQLFSDALKHEAKKVLKDSNVNFKLENEQGIITKNLQEKRMILDMLTYLPDEVLSKTDRASMKYSLEVRCPLLDYRIIEWSFGLKHSYKYRHFEKKYILKQLTYEYVPKNLLDRPKNGFGVPLQKWLRGVLSEQILRYSDQELLKKQGIFDSEGIHNLIEKQKTSDSKIYSNLLWAFYVFQRWYYYYIDEKDRV